MKDGAISTIEVCDAVAPGTSIPRLRLGVLAFLQRLFRLSERPRRRLRLCESLALGERRFVAVIEFEQRRFLVGGTGQSLALLANLDEREQAMAEERQ